MEAIEHRYSLWGLTFGKKNIQNTQIRFRARVFEKAILPLHLYYGIAGAFCAAQIWNSGWVDPESCCMVYERHSPLDSQKAFGEPGKSLNNSRFERGRRYGSLFKIGHP